MMRRILIVLFAAFTLVACGGGGGSPVAAITAQPTDRSEVAGNAATFSVTATDATGYQWQRSTDGGATFSDVAGATAASHTTPATTLGDSGTQYRVVVAGVANSVTSSAATLTVTATPVAPAISVQPAGQTVTAGQDASFSVTATGTAPAYQWQRSTDGGTTFTDESGATGATLQLAIVPLAQDGHFFRVVVSNTVGSVTSSAARLTVSPAGNAPAFTTQPVSVSITEGQNTQFSVVVSGTPAPTLEWQVSVNNGVWFGFGVTTPVYMVNGAAVADSGRQYRVVATNSAGTATSNAALLTVTAAATAPVFTTQPASATIVAGQNAQFTVAASGSPSPTFQWQLSTDAGANWGNIVGQTGTVYNVSGAVLADNGRQYRAVASNSAGSANSNAAVLTVTAAPPATGPTLVSVTPTGVAANNTSAMPSLSADGKLIAFTSVGTDLVAGFSSTDYGHAYLRNLTAGVTSVINQTPSGGISTHGVVNVKLAAGGRYAVFSSLAGDLVAGDTNGSLDVFLRDLQAATTTRLNVLANGAQITGAGNSIGDLRLNISADGRWVTFISGYDLLGNGDPLNYNALFLRDTQNNVTRMIASDSASQTMGQPSLSGDGRYLVYPVSDFSTGQYHLMRYDTQSFATSSLFTDAQDPTSYYVQGMATSFDGRYVSFALRSATVLGGAAASYPQIVVLDSGVPDNDPARLSLVSTGTGGVGDGRSGEPVISGHGRYVAFITYSPGLTGDPAATVRSYVMLRDRVAGTTQVASRRVNGSSVWVWSMEPHLAMSSDGSTLGFVADVANMGLAFTAGGYQVFAAPRP